MLSDLNTIVQFFSALYVTIAIDNMMFNRFWTPDVFAVVENALKKFDFALSTPKQQELLNVILVPIVMRIVINWLYSTVYVKYLDVRLTEEYVAYQNTKKAIRSKNKDLCDFRYDGVYKEVFFSADKSQDNVETVLVNKLLDYLSFACKPVRVLELLCYRFSADYRNDNNNVSKGNEEASYELPE